MSEDPDLERRLEAMFTSARPRRGFEEELWRRIEARRPWHQRLGRRFQPALRYAPALATILVVALGVTWLAGNFRGGESSGTTTASAPAFGSGQKSGTPAFGVLPRPAAERSSTAPQTSAGSADSSAGAAFSGSLPGLPAELPVYRYDEPTAADRATTAATLQARSGIAVIVSPSDGPHGVEPQFTVSGPLPGGAQSGTLEAAGSFLTSHHLAPWFPFQVAASSSGSQVVYGRQFDGPAGHVRQVRPDGLPAGLTVDFAAGTVTARGPLDLPLTSASYPLRSAADALNAANVRPGSGAGTLTHAELVYVLVVADGHGYYEPALLLTGPGAAAVLAPVIAQGWLTA